MSNAYIFLVRKINKEYDNKISKGYRSFIFKTFKNLVIWHKPFLSRLSLILQKYRLI